MIASLAIIFYPGAPRFLVDCCAAHRVCVTSSQGVEAARACSDAGHRAVRLGNPLVALSKIDKDDFAAIFDGNVGSLHCSVVSFHLKSTF